MTRDKSREQKTRLIVIVAVVLDPLLMTNKDVYESANVFVDIIRCNNKPNQEERKKYTRLFILTNRFACCTTTWSVWLTASVTVIGCILFESTSVDSIG